MGLGAVIAAGAKALGAGIVSIGSAIVSGVSHVCSVAGGFLGKAATAISGFATKAFEVGQRLFKGIDAIGIVEKVSKGVSGISEVLEIKSPGLDSPEEISYKVREADKQPEDFASTSEYLDYLHNEIQVDKAKIENHDPEQRAIHSIIGSYVYLKAISDKLGVDEIDATFILNMAKLGISAEIAVSIIKNLKNNGITNTGALDKFLHGKADNIEQAAAVDKALYNTFKESDPDMSDKEIDSKIAQMDKDLES